MLDIKFIREDAETVKKALARRGADAAQIGSVVEADKKRRAIIQEVEGLKAENNRASSEIAKMKKEGRDASGAIAGMKAVTDKIKALDSELSSIEARVNETLLGLPNIPHGSVPDGADDKSNKLILEWGEKPSFSFKPLPHWEIGEKLDILDNDRAAKITGARFTVYKGAGALLERALINFMLDIQTREHGYTEVAPPVLVNRASMTGTGQLPKFEDDSFKLAEPDWFLSPTAEVQVTNMHREEIIPAAKLPIYYAAYTPCFRKEAGAHGKDTKGIIRMHQFNKVELVKFVLPETSFDELEKLLKNAEEILKRLNLHYRVMLLCAGDTGFASAKTYDIEAWQAGAEAYREVSSCSNFTDFQARRASIKYRGADNKPVFLHTLNGSGLATSRLLPAILEAYQTKDMEVIVPEVLRPYMGGIDRITKK
ncbi:MAG TPA: serine--tRNA ligase [bacterium]|nr:serine--tRNA ligase [bacterium]